MYDCNYSHTYLFTPKNYSHTFLFTPKKCAQSLWFCQIKIKVLELDIIMWLTKPVFSVYVF